MSLLKKCVPTNIISDMKLVLSTLNSQSAPSKVLSNIDDHLIANTESFLWPWNIILNPNISMEKSEKKDYEFLLYYCNIDVYDNYHDAPILSYYFHQT